MEKKINLVKGHVKINQITFILKDYDFWVNPAILDCILVYLCLLSYFLQKLYINYQSYKIVGEAQSQRK